MTEIEEQNQSFEEQAIYKQPSTPEFERTLEKDRNCKIDTN
jgi:hypothetical protein